MANRFSTALSVLRYGPGQVLAGLQQAQTNLFNQAFFAFLGGQFTNYDVNGQTYLDKGYNDNPDVYAVVSQISRKFASVPGILKAGDKEYPEPLPKPNYYQYESEFKELWCTFMLLTGNAYQWILSPEDGANKGKPLARFLLPAHLVKIVLKKDAALQNLEDPIDYYMLVIGNTFIQFKSEDIIHSKFPNPNYDLAGSHLYGQSPLRAALRDIQASNVTIDHGISTMKNGGVYGFIHAKDGQTPLTADQATELKSRLIQMQASTEALGRISGASAPLGFTQVSIDTDKLQPHSFRAASQKAICNVLGWSDKLLNNDEGAKYDNLNGAWKMSISNRITPDLKIYEQGLNEKYYPRFKELNGAKIQFDVSELPEMQEDMKGLAEWMEIALRNGAITPEEFRIALKYPPTNQQEMKEHYFNGTPIVDVAVNDQTIARAFNLDQNV